METCFLRHWLAILFYETIISRRLFPRKCILQVVIIICLYIHHKSLSLTDEIKRPVKMRRMWNTIPLTHESPIPEKVIFCFENFAGNLKQQNRAIFFVIIFQGKILFSLALFLNAYFVHTVTLIFALVTLFLPLKLLYVRWPVSVFNGEHYRP